MALIDSNNKEDLKTEFVDIIQYMEDEDKEQRKKKVFAWTISIISHAAVCLIMMLIITATQTDFDEPTVKITYLQPNIPLPENKTISKLEKLPIEINTEDVVKDPVVSDLMIEEISSDETLVDDPNPTPEGRQDAIASSENGGPGQFMMIGAGTNSAGIFGNRTPSGKKRNIGRLGANGKAATESLDRGLRWLKKHQSQNGQWDTDQYFVNCQDKPKCEPGKDQAGEADYAITGYAILCFLGNGYDHRLPSKFKQTVKNGIDWLIASQKPDGLFGQRNYEHAIATMAICEAYAMTNDPALRIPAQNAINVILSRQIKSKDYGYGWDYITPTERNDASITGWNVMALKSASAGGINIQNGLTGSKQWLEQSWKASNGNWKSLTPYDKSIFPYVWNSDTGVIEKDHLSFVGAACAVFLGHTSGDIMLETMLNDMDTRWLAKCSIYPHNLYASYYAMMAAFQSGGTHWEKWMNGIVPALLKAQRTDGCFDGSWDQAIDFHGADTGRMLSTTYALLNMSVVFRYAPIAETKNIKTLQK